MQFGNKLLIHEEFAYVVVESDLRHCDCISLANEQKVEQMIFLGRVEDYTGYEVRVCKANPSDTYVIHEDDTNLKKHESNDKFASFFFDDFVSARHFLVNLKKNHPEYSVRPVAKS